MTPLDWRAKAREALMAAGQRCFVRFARTGEETLFVTDAQDARALETAGFCVKERTGRVAGFDVPDAWYAKCSGIKPAEEDVSPCAWLSRRLMMAQGDQTQITPQGRAFLREVARGCFAPGGADEKTMLDLRARAAILQRRHDTGAFAAAAGLAAAKTKEV